MKRILRSIWSGWKKFAHALGVFNTKVILTLLYFTVIGIAAVLARIFGADLLDRRFDRAGSLWKLKPPSGPSLEEARRQF
jgi:hypothetical protein